MLHLDEVDEEDVPPEWKELAATERATLARSRDKWHVRFKLKYEKGKYESCAKNGSTDVYVVCAICAKAGVVSNCHKTGGGKVTEKKPRSIENFKQTHVTRDVHPEALNKLHPSATAVADEGGEGGASPAVETAPTGEQSKRQKTSQSTLEAFCKA